MLKIGMSNVDKRRRNFNEMLTSSFKTWPIERSRYSSITMR